MFVEITRDNLDDHLPAAALMGRANVLAGLAAGYTVHFNKDFFLYRFINGERSIVVRHILFPFNSMSASELVRNKAYAAALLKDAGFPVLRSYVLSKNSDSQLLKSILEQVSFPLVVKPASSYMGKGVQTNITTHKELTNIIQEQFDAGIRKIIIEPFVQAENDYRFFIFKGKLEAVLQRIKPYVVGNGESTIAELIELKNIERGKNVPLKMKPILVDDECIRTITHAGYTVDSVLQAGQRLTIKNVCNMNAGGETAAVDVSTVHPRNIEIAIQAVGEMGLELAGVDILCNDISKPIDENGGVINEINSKPDYSLHQYPNTGEPIDLAPVLINALFK